MKTALAIIISIFSSNYFSQEVEEDTIPEIHFNLKQVISETRVQLYQNNILLIDTIAADSLLKLSPYKYGYDYKLTYSKKKYTPKTVMIYAKDYSGVMEVITIIEFDMNIHPWKEFKSKKPYDEPVAIMNMDSTGHLNFDFKYINQRLEIINGSRKKKYRDKE